MRRLRKGFPESEYWEAEDLAHYLNCSIEQAEKYMKDYHKEKRTCRYGAIEKALILDYVEQKQREQREREARHLSDIANAEKTAILKEQVKTFKEQVNTLKEMYAASSEDARKARLHSFAANCIAIISLAVAIVALVLKSA